MRVCGHTWSDGGNDKYHRVHVCGEENIKGHMHVCVVRSCRGVK